MFGCESIGYSVAKPNWRNAFVKGNVEPEKISKKNLFALNNGCSFEGKNCGCGVSDASESFFILSGKSIGSGNTSSGSVTVQ